MSCGGCQNYLKWKNDLYGGGLCQLYDLRTSSDCGHKCKGFKRIPYNRNKEKHLTLTEIHDTIE